MNWNWQKSDWPNFRLDHFRLSHIEEQFLVGAGIAIGTVKHYPQMNRRLAEVVAIA